MADTQKFITIKAKDGTMKKVPLSEFQKMKETGNRKTIKQENKKTSKHSDIQTSKQETGNKKQETGGMKTSKHTNIKTLKHQNIKTSKQENIKTGKQEVGNSSKAGRQGVINDEQRGAVQKAPTSVKQDSVLSDVLSVLDFSVSKDLEGRLGALIETRLSGIRTDEQVRDYATRTVGDGGLGLSDSQAASLVDAMQRVEKGESAAKEPALEKPAPKEMSPKKEILEEDANSDFDELSRVAGGRDLPVQEKKSAPRPPEPKKQEERKQENAVPMPPRAAAPARIPARPAPGGQRARMQDVRPPASTMGPVSPIDELRLMQLVDFRRLGGSADDRRERLLRKFETLRGESYVAYLDGRRAWFSSPLYRQYQEKIVQAINGGQPVQGFLGGGDDLDAGEFATLIEVNRAVNI